MLLEDCLMFERPEPGVYERDTDRTWWGHDAQFGGYVEALALRAMLTELRSGDAALRSGDAAAAPELVPVSLTIQFFRPFVDGLFRAEVTVARRGRTMANVRAQLYSQGKLAGQAVAAFGIRRPHAEFLAAVPPDALATSPLGAEEREAPSQIGIPTHGNFQFFPRIGAFKMGGSASGGGNTVGGWVRPRFDTAVDESLMVMLQDLWLPAAYELWQLPAVAVSVDITTQFRAAFPATVSATKGVFVVLRTAGSIGGFVDEDCELWSSDGQLLAQGRQLRYVH